MNCERLLHGDRAYKPYPEFGYKIKDEIDGPKIVREKQDCYPYKCLRNAP